MMAIKPRLAPGIRPVKPNASPAMWRCSLGLLSAALFLPLSAGAQEAAAPSKPLTPQKAPEPITAIVHGDVWTVTKGIIKDGAVLIQGTKILKVGGPDLKVPDGAKIIDARGKIVSPGFIVTNASLGSGGLALGGQIKDSLDPFSLSISLALSSGVTSAYVAGGAGGGGFGGRRGGAGGRGAAAPGGAISTANAVIKMIEGDLDGMVAADPAIYTLNAGGGGRGGGRFPGAGGGGGGNLSTRWEIRDQFTRAKQYVDKQAQADSDRKAGKTATNPVMPADAAGILPLLRKERILRVTASTVSEIRWALKMVDDFGIRMVISPATEAWVIPEEIAKRNVLLIITARDRSLPDERRNAASGASFDAAGILQKAGVRFALLPPDNTFSTGGELGRDLLTYPLEGAYAMRGGMDAQGALEALTITAAETLGMEKTIGSLEEGKDADILILSGDPLDYRSFVEKTFVNGRLLYDKATSTFFRDIKPSGPSAN
jgi:imidazolonepropionase-like amidohydrolase